LVEEFVVRGAAFLGDILNDFPPLNDFPSTLSTNMPVSKKASAKNMTKTGTNDLQNVLIVISIF
jgi:hypothetical protein